MELQEVRREETKVGAREQPEEQGRHELHPEPVIPEDPEEIAVREGIHERIQTEIHHKDKEVEALAEEMLEDPPEWNDVPDLMMEDKEVQLATEAAVKLKIDEVTGGGENSRNNIISAWRNVNTQLQCHGEHGIQRILF